MVTRIDSIQTVGSEINYCMFGHLRAGCVQEQRATDTTGARLRILGRTLGESAGTVRFTTRRTDRERIPAQTRLTGLLARSLPLPIGSLDNRDHLT